MARADHFTPAEDEAIRIMRDDQASWQAIGQHLGRSYHGCRKRWAALGGGSDRSAPPPPIKPAGLDFNRPRGHDLLLPGDWRTRGTITAGTMLEGML